MLSILRPAPPAPPEWQPGDPLHVDRSCGGVPDVRVPDAQAEAIRAEDVTPPPWWRPVAETASVQNRVCEPCGVRWNAPTAADSACWMCGAVSPGINPIPNRGARP